MSIDIEHGRSFPFCTGMGAHVTKTSHYSLRCCLIYWPLDLCIFVCWFIQSRKCLVLRAPVGQS